MHKKPSKQRFIAASKACSTKVLSTVLTKCLKLVQQQHSRYCKAIENFSGFDRFWIVDNSTSIVELINKSNLSSVKDVKTYDFSTLYTNIPHSELKRAMAWVIKKAFTGQGKKYINVQKTRTCWSDSKMKPREGNWQVTKKELLDMVFYLIDNIYVTCGDKVFRQIIGIPMGTDCAPFLANLFLYFYEFQFMERMAKKKNPDVYRFRKVARYLDDLIIIGGGDVMEKYISEIYPRELVLKLENQNDQSASFLDLFLNIVEGKIQYKLYDKRDDFPFEIVNYPDLSGNICSTNAFGVLIGQLLRIAKACQKYSDFLDRAKALINKLVRQSFPKKGFKSRLVRVYKNHPHHFQKYGIDLETFISHLEP